MVLHKLNTGPRSLFSFPLLVLFLSEKGRVFPDSRFFLRDFSPESKIPWEKRAINGSGKKSCLSFRFLWNRKNGRPLRFLWNLRGPGVGENIGEESRAEIHKK